MDQRVCNFAPDSSAIADSELIDLEPLVNNLVSILQRTAPCQIDDDEEEDAGAEQSEYDAALISAACDLVGTLATVLGGDFASLFPMFFPPMKAYYVRSFSYSTMLMLTFSTIGRYSISW